MGCGADELVQVNTAAAVCVYVCNYLIKLLGLRQIPRLPSNVEDETENVENPGVCGEVYASSSKVHILLIHETTKLLISDALLPLSVCTMRVSAKLIS